MELDIFSRTQALKNLDNKYRLGTISHMNYMKTLIDLDFDKSFLLKKLGEWNRIGVLTPTMDLELQLLIYKHFKD